jgi:hypothetical protein
VEANRVLELALIILEVEVDIRDPSLRAGRQRIAIGILSYTTSGVDVVHCNLYSALDSRI